MILPAEPQEPILTTAVPVPGLKQHNLTCEQRVEDPA